MVAQGPVFHPLHDPRGHRGAGCRLCDGAARSAYFASRKANPRTTRGWRALRSPWSIAFHIILLAGFVYHTWSWFQIMPKTMPSIVIGGKKLQPAVITAAGLAGRRRCECWGASPHAGHRVMRRSNAPIFWSLFGAGGVLSALIGPMLVFITGIAVPLGLVFPRDLMSYPAHAVPLPSIGRARFFCSRSSSLFLWHGAHRIFHSLHDFGHKDRHRCKAGLLWPRAPRHRGFGIRAACARVLNERRKSDAPGCSQDGQHTTAPKNSSCSRPGRELLTCIKRALNNACDFGTEARKLSTTRHRA